MAIFPRCLLDRESRGQGEVPSCSMLHLSMALVMLSWRHGQGLPVVVAVASFLKGSDYTHWAEQLPRHCFISSGLSDQLVVTTRIPMERDSVAQKGINYNPGRMTSSSGIASSQLSIRRLSRTSVP